MGVALLPPPEKIKIKSSRGTKKAAGAGGSAPNRALPAAAGMGDRDA